MYSNIRLYNNSHYIYCFESYIPVSVYFNNVEIGKSSCYIIMLEENYEPVIYFNNSDLNMDYIKEYKNSDFIMPKNTDDGRCPYKGNIKWFSIVYGKNIEEKAAWSYNNPPEYLKIIENLIAFYNNKINIYYKRGKINVSDILINVNLNNHPIR